MFNLSNIFSKPLVKDEKEPEQKPESKPTPKPEPKSAPVEENNSEAPDSKYKIAAEKIAVRTPESKATSKNTSSVLNEIKNRNTNIIQTSKAEIDGQKQEKLKEAKTTSDILQQSKIANVHLKTISDNLIDEQDTKVKRVSQLQSKSEPTTIQSETKKAEGGMGWLAAAAAFLAPLIAKLVKNAVAGVWKFVKSSIAKVWSGIKTIGSWIKNSPVGKAIGGLIDKGKNLLGFGDDAAKGVKTVSTAATGAKTVATGTKTASTAISGAKTVSTSATAAKALPASGVIKKVSQKLVSPKVLKEIIKTVAAKKLSKIAASKIPIAGALVGAVASAMYAMQGDMTGATAALGSAALGATGVGAPAALAIDILLIAREVYKIAYGLLPDNDPDFTKRFSDVKIAVTQYINEWLASKKDLWEETKTTLKTTAVTIIPGFSFFSKLTEKAPPKTQLNTKVPTTEANPNESYFSNFISNAKTKISDFGSSISNTVGGAVNDIVSGAGDALQWSKNLLVSKADVQKALQLASTKTGVPFDILAKIANIESGFNPSAKAGTSSAGGLFQFLDSTWAAMMKQHGAELGLKGNESKFDPVASALLGGAYIKDNMKSMQSVKAAPNATDVYIAHFMGAGGARSFLGAMGKDPSANASAFFPAAAKANKNIFFTKDGQPRSLQAIYTLFQNKLGDNGTTTSIMSNNQSATGGRPVNVPPSTNNLGKGGPTGPNRAGGQTPQSNGGGSSGGGFFSGISSAFSSAGSVVSNFATNLVQGAKGAFKSGNTPGLTVAGGQTKGMNPNFLDNISAMSKEFYGKYKRNLVMTSGYRSSETQAALYKDAVAKYGASAGSYVAPPGRSLHEKGIAADINFSSSLKKDIDLADNTGLLAKYGLWRPLKDYKSKEHWHIEPIGSRKGADKSAPGDGLNNPAAKPTPKALTETKQEMKPKPATKTADTKSIKPNPEAVKKQKELLTPVTNKCNKEQAVNTNSKSLAQGTKSREAEGSQSNKTGANIININSSNSNEKQSGSAKELFREGKINK